MKKSTAEHERRYEYFINYWRQRSIEHVKDYVKSTGFFRGALYDIRYNFGTINENALRYVAAREVYIEWIFNKLDEMNKSSEQNLEDKL